MSPERSRVRAKFFDSRGWCGCSRLDISALERMLSGAMAKAHRIGGEDLSAMNRFHLSKLINALVTPKKKLAQAIETKGAQKAAGP